MSITRRNRAIAAGYDDRPMRPGSAHLHTHAASIRRDQCIVGNRALVFAVAEHAIAREQAGAFLGQRVDDHAPARFGQFEPAVQADEQRLGQRLLEIPDALGQRWLGDVQRLRRAGKFSSRASIMNDSICVEDNRMVTRHRQVWVDHNSKLWRHKPAPWPRRKIRFKTCLRFPC
jgi:hypothetical protein